MKGEKPKVLVIDDERELVETLEKFLYMKGYEVFGTTSPDKALKILKEREIDVILTDLKMPEMDGLQLVQRAREQNPLVEIIVFTAYASIETAVEAIKRGAFNYIPKPFKMEHLLSLIEKALENQYLRQENIMLKSAECGMVWESNVMEEIVKQARKASLSDVNVLITGESGTGKEVLARFIHHSSRRAQGPFIIVDLTSIPENLLESELFGYSKGAFTGATENKTGLVESAEGGTCFFDEVGEIPPTLQTKMLRLTETKTLRRLGDSSLREVNARFIFATNRDLKEMVKQGKFREDLYYRLKVFNIYIPPLRERKDDIKPLAYHSLNMFSRKYNTKVRYISDEALKKLRNYPWPGNVRELKNTLERAVITCEGEIIKEEHIIFEEESDSHLAMHQTERKRFLKKMDRTFIMNLIEQCGGNISLAAKKAGVSRSTIYRILHSSENEG